MGAVIFAITTLVVAAFFLTVALLLLGEVAEALRWAVAGMTACSGPSSERKIFEGMLLVLAGALWLVSSAVAAGWIATLLLNGHGPSVMWGSSALTTLVVLWWFATLRLHAIRQHVRREHGLAAPRWRPVTVPRQRSNIRET